MDKLYIPQNGFSKVKYISLLLFLNINPLKQMFNTQ